MQTLSNALTFHSAFLTHSKPTALDVAYARTVQALLDPQETLEGLIHVLNDDPDGRSMEWWWGNAQVLSPPQSIMVWDAPDHQRLDDATTLLAYATMAPQPWVWPTLVEHWTRHGHSSNAIKPVPTPVSRPWPTSSKATPPHHVDWSGVTFCCDNVHQASLSTISWWLDQHPAFTKEPLSPHAPMLIDHHRELLVNAWWRGLNHWARHGISDNVTLAGYLPRQDVWSIFELFEQHGLASFGDWSTLRALDSHHGDAMVMSPIEAVIGLTGSQSVVERWLSRGGDPNLTNPYSAVALVHRALQHQSPTNLAALIQAGASLDVPAGVRAKTKRENVKYGRDAGLSSYPWVAHRDVTLSSTIQSVTVPPTDPWWDIRAFPGPHPIEVERASTWLSMEEALALISNKRMAMNVRHNKGVEDVWDALAWQSWADGRLLRQALEETLTGLNDEPSRTLPAPGVRRRL